MKPFAVLVAILLLPVVTLARSAPASQLYTGVISETMCGITHTSMGITPDPKCIVECVKHGQGVRYVLIEENSKAMYVLSDQQTPNNSRRRRCG